jgi:hypothetical protein
VPEEVEGLMATRKKVEDIPGTKAHQIYKLKDGTRVPGGSTIAKIAGANQSERSLTKWANELGLAGHDKEKYIDKLANVGTLLHDMALYYFLKRSPVDLFGNYDQWTVDQAAKCYLKFEEWTKDKEFDPIHLEVPFVSETYHFGGTPDFYGRIQFDGKWYHALLDWKTSKGIYDSHWYQTVGYGKMLEHDHGKHLDLVGVVKMPRSDEEKFAFKHKPWTEEKVGVYWEIFQIGLDLYYAQKRLPKFWE